MLPPSCRQNSCRQCSTFATMQQLWAHKSKGTQTHNVRKIFVVVVLKNLTWSSKQSKAFVVVVLKNLNRKLHAVHFLTLPTDAAGPRFTLLSGTTGWALALALAAHFGFFSVSVELPSSAGSSLTCFFFRDDLSAGICFSAISFIHVKFSASISIQTLLVERPSVRMLSWKPSISTAGGAHVWPRP